MMSTESFESISRSINLFLSNFQDMSDEDKWPFRECTVGLDTMPFDRSYQLRVYGDQAFMGHDMNGSLLVAFLHVTTREERMEMAAEVQRVIRRSCEDLDEVQILRNSLYIDAPDPTSQEIEVKVKKPPKKEEAMEPDDSYYSVGLNFDLLD